MVISAGSQAGRKPVAAHPLFTATVSLWTGALLALSTLAAHPAVLFAGLSELKLSRIAPTGFTTVLYNQTLLAVVLGAIGCIAGMAIARLAKGRTEAIRKNLHRDILVMPDIPSLSLAATQGLREPAVESEETKDTGPEPAAEPATTRQRPVLDIYAIDMTESSANEPLELTAFVKERHNQTASSIDALPVRSREDTERALRDALATLRDLRGAA